MTKEQQMQVCKLCEQQGIKHAINQTIKDARIAALEVKLGINSQSEEGDVKKNEKKTPNEPSWGRKRGNPAVTHQVSGAKHKEPG